MVSAAVRKSVTDLSRRRARTAFTVTTLALAVASIAFFAVPTLIDRAMQAEVREDRLADVTIALRPLPLTGGQLAALAALPNVAAVEPRNGVDTRVLVGERRTPARIFGVRDFARQRVDLVRVASGAAPGPGEVLSDVQNANVGRYDGRAGDRLALVGPGRDTAGPPGGRAGLRVSGEARNIAGGEEVQDENLIVLYATAATVAALSGDRGYGRLSFLLDDPSPAAAARTVVAIRRHLRTVPGFAGFRNLPGVRAPGDWPGREDSEQFARFLGVITALALLAALVLISNTMTTLVAEQEGEIGVMRAIGARRRQVALVYARTALLLGAFGAVAGIALGILIANLLARYFGSTFWAVDVDVGVDARVLAVSLLVGLAGPLLAVLPAIRRAVRVPLRESLESTGSVEAGGRRADRVLRRARHLPRTTQIGLRNLGRRTRRSLATALIVAVAVGNLLAIMGLASAVTDVTRSNWDDHLEDVRVWTTGRVPFDERAEAAILGTPGVAETQPALVNDVGLAGEEAVVWGVPHEPLLRHRVSDGRWFSPAEERRREPVAVIERDLARATGVGVGDRIVLETAAGPTPVDVVGVADNQQEDGTVLFVPLTTLRAALGEQDDASTYWIRTDSPDQTLVDRTTSRVEDRLAALGYEVGSEITYVGERDDIAANRTITTTIAVLGFLIVAMSMVGLASAITTSILERTREIGVLRCLGARARDVRRIFATEGLAMAVSGWILGIPLGYALDHLLVWLVREIVNVEVAVAFPPWNIVIALVGTVAFALLVLVLPLGRAVRLRPGAALRHA